MDSPGTDGIASCGLPDGVAPLGPDERVLLDVGMQYDALSFHAWSWAVPGGMAFALVCMIPVALLSGAPPTLAHGALYLVLTCIGVVPILRMWRGYCSRRRLVVTSHRTIGVKFGDPVRVVEIPHGPDVSVSAKEFWLKVKGDRRRIWMWGVPDVFRVSRLVEGLLANATRREQPVPRQAREARILPMDDAPKEEALDIIRSSGLSELAYLLTSLLQHSIRLKTARTDMTHVPLGVSRMGGVPDLPGSVAWPQVEGQYLTFLAQLRMADVASLDVEGLLPRSGWLYFFADASGEIPGYGRDGRVVYFDGREDDLTRAEEPALPAFAHGYKACLLELRGEWTLPDFAVALPAEYCREVKIGGGDTVLVEPKAYRAMRDALRHWRRMPIHRLLGHPEQVQGDVALEWVMQHHGVSYDALSRDAAEACRAEGPDWVLLLQVDSDEDGPGWTWSDEGMLYFGIRKADLAARRFDRARCTLQCY